MSVESELKFSIEEPEALRATLIAAGATPLYPESFEDNLVWDRGGELGATGRLLRLRIDGRGARLTLKGVASFDRGVKERVEHETAVADSEATKALLTDLGYRVVRRYQKYRQSWRLGECEAVIDRTPMGVFAEFEGRDAVTVAQNCGLLRDEALTGSYLALWDAYREAHPEAPIDMLFGATGDSGVGGDDG